MSSQYDNVVIVKIKNDNSTKLIIGSEISNFLMTSKLGPTTANFNITDRTRLM